MSRFDKRSRKASGCDDETRSIKSNGMALEEEREQTTAARIWKEPHQIEAQFAAAMSSTYVFFLYSSSTSCGTCSLSEYLVSVLSISITSLKQNHQQDRPWLMCIRRTRSPPRTRSPRSLDGPIGDRNEIG